MSHRCHARDCGAPVPPSMLMCRRHWFKVPKRVRDQVWDAYSRGQEVDKRPSPEWHEAADAAIGYVAWLERRSLRPAEVRAMVALGVAGAKVRAMLAAAQGPTTIKCTVGR